MGSFAVSGVVLGIHTQTSPLTSLVAETQHQDHPLLLLDWVSFLPHWLHHPLCPLPGLFNFSSNSAPAKRAALAEVNSTREQKPWNSEDRGVQAVCPAQLEAD